MRHLIWKKVPGYPEYEVSEYGHVMRDGRELPQLRRDLYSRKTVRLSKDGVQKVFQVAHLVAFAFIGPRPFPEAHLCHTDGFEHNNHYTNLRWDAPIGNAADKLEQLSRRNAHKRTERFERRKELSAAASRFLAKHELAARPPRGVTGWPLSGARQ